MAAFDRPNATGLFSLSVFLAAEVNGIAAGGASVVLVSLEVLFVLEKRNITFLMSRLISFFKTD